MITIDPIKRPPKKSSSVDTTEIMKEVDQKFADLIDGAPDNLNTIKELAEAVANSPRIDNLETKVTELENKKIPEATVETVGGVKKFEIMDLQDKSNIDNLYKAYNTLVEQMVNAGVAEDTRFVDLGLPSGTLWSNYNLGSDSIEDPGLYFQWG